MNDIAKQATADKFLQVLKKEHLSKKEAGKCIGFTDVQVSYLFNKHYWDRLGNVYWGRVLAWVNSGQGLQEYGVKHGKVVPEKSGYIKPKTVDDVMDNVAKSAERQLRRAEKKKTVDLGNGVGKTTTIEEKEYKLSVRLAEIGWILGSASKGRTSEQIAKELGIYLPIVKAIMDGKLPSNEEIHTYLHEQEQVVVKPLRPSVGEMVDMLIEERKSLQGKIEAIEVLLKHYIS